MFCDVSSSAKKNYITHVISCFIFSELSRIRKLCLRITENFYFKNILVLLIIIIHSILLGLYDFKVK